MLRKVGLAISYFIAIVYFFSILLPAVYCLQHGFKGPGELDAFMPAFMLTPLGAIATAFSLHNAVTTDQKKPIIVLDFLASRHCFCDCYPRRNRFYRAHDL
jgi:hypothetical protein